MNILLTVLGQLAKVEEVRFHSPYPMAQCEVFFCTVDVAVLDTGIYSNNTCFGGRAISGYSACRPNRQANKCTFVDADYISTSSLVTGSSVGSTNDGNGHGTWVAGFVMAKIYGVARSGNTWAVKVLDDAGVGTTSGIIAGINWAVTHKITWNRKTIILITFLSTPNPSIDAALTSVSFGSFRKHPLIVKSD